MTRERKEHGTSRKGSAANPATPKGEARKPYAAPKVRAYGNIREITLGVGSTGTKDSAPGSHKTNT